MPGAAIPIANSSDASFMGDYGDSEIGAQGRGRGRGREPKSGYVGIALTRDQRIRKNMDRLYRLHHKAEDVSDEIEEAEEKLERLGVDVDELYDSWNEGYEVQGYEDEEDEEPAPPRGGGYEGRPGFRYVGTVDEVRASGPGRAAQMGQGARQYVIEDEDIEDLPDGDEDDDGPPPPPPRGRPSQGPPQYGMRIDPRELQELAEEDDMGPGSGPGPEYDPDDPDGPDPEEDDDDDDDPRPYGELAKSVFPEPTVNNAGRTFSPATVMGSHPWIARSKFGQKPKGQSGMRGPPAPIGAFASWASGLIRRRALKYGDGVPMWIYQQNIGEKQIIYYIAALEPMPRSVRDKLSKTPGVSPVKQIGRVNGSE